MTIIEFLNARYDEDETAAKAAGSAPWVANIPRSVHVDPKARAENKHAFRRQGYIASVENPGVQTHIAHHHPAHTLREIAAKRAILLQYTDAVTSWEEDREAPDAVGALEAVLRHMASVYADHPDYPDYPDYPEATAR